MLHVQYFEFFVFIYIRVRIFLIKTNIRSLVKCNFCRVATDIPPITHNKSNDHWDIETGYNEKASNDILSFPYRAHSGGSRGALVVLLNLNVSDFDHMCRGPIVGFKGK